MSQEDGGSQALREEVFSKERSLLELRTAMKEVSCELEPPPARFKRTLSVRRGLPATTHRN